MLLQRGAPVHATLRAPTPQQRRALSAAGVRPRSRRAAAAAVAAASLGRQGNDEAMQPRVVMDARTMELRLETAADGPSTSAGRRDAALVAYGALKQELLKNTGGLGLSLAAYLSLSQHDGAVGASALLGAAGGVAYMALLCRHVDVMGTPGHAVRGLPKKANPGENLGALFLSAVARVGDIYWNALAHPQLLVPVALAAGGSAWNGMELGPDVQFIYVLLGFMSYKVAVLDQAYKALKAVTLYAQVDTNRPVIKDLPDIDAPY